MTAHAPPEQEPYLTVKELAVRWKTTPNAIRIMRHRRKGPRSYKFRGQVRFPVAEIVAYETEAPKQDSRWNTDLDPTKCKADRTKRPARKRAASKPATTTNGKSRSAA